MADIYNEKPSDEELAGGIKEKETSDDDNLEPTGGGAEDASGFKLHPTRWIR